MDNLSIEGRLQAAASGLHERRNGCEGSVTSTKKLGPHIPRALSVSHHWLVEFLGKTRKSRAHDAGRIIGRRRKQKVTFLGAEGNSLGRIMRTNYFEDGGLLEEEGAEGNFSAKERNTAQTCCMKRDIDKLKPTPRAHMFTLLWKETVGKMDNFSVAGRLQADCIVEAEECEGVTPTSLIWRDRF